MLDPASTYLDSTVKLGADVTLFPGTILQGDTVIGSGSEIGPHTRLVDCVIGPGSVVEQSNGRDAEVGSHCAVGPFAVLSPGAALPDGTVTGPFYAAAGPDES
jgi:bifunctional UDP-N-acetylglucosamine pyrophosphorylase/glucosamine-1-phosphate N-acetyltransferase